jgi:hypothetical protein
MTDLEILVKEFFNEYERANAEFDIQRIAERYADAFMFGGPAGVQPVKKEEFVKVLPRRKEFFKSSGLVASTIESLEVSSLDSSMSWSKWCGACGSTTKKGIPSIVRTLQPTSFR